MSELIVLKSSAPRTGFACVFSGVLIVVLMLTSCSNELSQSSLDEHIQIWNDANIADYSYELVEYCYCNNSGMVRMVEVRNNVVVSTSFLESQDVSAPGDGNSIREIYELITTALNSPNVRVTVNFSTDGARPTDVRLTNESAIDADVRVTLSNFRIE